MLITIEAGDPLAKQSAAVNIQFSVQSQKNASLSWSISLKADGQAPLVGDQVKAFSGKRTVFEGEVVGIKTSSGYINVSATGKQP